MKTTRIILLAALVTALASSVSAAIVSPVTHHRVIVDYAPPPSPVSFIWLFLQPWLP